MAFNPVRGDDDDLWDDRTPPDEDDCDDEDEAYYVALEEHWNAVQLPAPPTPENP